VSLGRPRTAVGFIVAALNARRDAGLPPFTAVSCDNLPDNGALLRDAVIALAGVHDAGLADWIATYGAFPSSMVDRIVPATTPEAIEAHAAKHGYRDEALVETERFCQWVLQDSFVGEWPDLPAAGITLTSDVAAWEEAKLRLLNGAHSLLAYTGALAGYETIDEALADERLEAAARGLMVQDAAPTLDLPDGFDLAGYQESILERFANRQLRYRTVQVAGDGSMKVPIRLLGTVRDRRAAGAEPVWAALGVAAWMVYVADGTRPLDDPNADELRKAVNGHDSPAGIVDALLGVRQVFDEELAADAVFRALLITHAGSLLGR